jgi:Na+/H+ antiporter NhaA
MRGIDVIGRIERGLRPILILVVFPLFAVANTGIELSGAVIADAVSSRVFWGVTLGLLVGKAVGISIFTLVAVRLGAGRLPGGVDTRYIPPVAILGGIGFTVALFIADLSFDSPADLGEAKLAILTASTLATVVGTWALRRTCRVRAVDIKG